MLKWLRNLFNRSFDRGVQVGTDRTVARIHRMVYGDFYDLAEDHGKWSEETFGHGGPEGSIKHLADEVREVAERPYCAEEYADCLLLVLDAARRANIDAHALVAAAKKKLSLNRVRTWVKHDSGYFKHVG